MVNGMLNNLGAAIADEHNVLKECKCQFFDANKYIRLCKDIKFGKSCNKEATVIVSTNKKKLRSHILFCLENFEKSKCRKTNCSRINFEKLRFHLNIPVEDAINSIK